MDFHQPGAILRAGGHINSNNTLTVQSERVSLNVNVRVPKPPIGAQLQCPLPSRKFVGRKDELARLSKFFTSDDEDYKSAALTGMGGCGKSQIAFQFVHEVLEKLDLYDPAMVFFVDASTTTTLEEGFASIAKSKAVGSTAEDAVRWLATVQKHSFTLIDNADSPNLDLSAWIPRSNRAHILITTRSQEAGRLYTSKGDALIEVNDGLPIQDATELLICTTTRPSDTLDLEEVFTLVQELYCYALAIAQAGACIAYRQLSIAEYLERFRRLRTSLLDGKADGVGAKALYGYSKVVATTWLMSYQELPVASKAFFDYCAHLHHTGIPLQLFEKAAYGMEGYEPGIPFSTTEETAYQDITKLLNSFRADGNLFDSFALKECVGPIVDLSLMRHDLSTEILSVHPLVQDSLRRVVPDSLPASFLLTLAVESDVEDSVFIYHLMPHVESVMQQSSVERACPLPIQFHPDLSVAFSRSCAASESWVLAESLQRAALTTMTTASHNNHHQVLRAWSLLTRTLNGSGRYAAAERLARCVLAHVTSRHGEDHVYTMRASDDLASALLALGKLDEAEAMYRKILTRRRQIQGKDHPGTANAMNTLANTMSELGRHNEAEPMQLEILERCRSISGEDHPDTVTAMNNLANTFSELGRHNEAETMRLEVLTRRRRILGEDHPETVAAMGNLANTISELGRHNEAETMQLEVLTWCRRALGEEHPKTAAAMSNLAITVFILGRHNEAIRMQVEILTRCRRVLGEDHPDTVKFILNLAATITSLGQYDAGEMMYLPVDVLTGMTHLPGKAHPDAIRTMLHLTLTVSHLGRFHQAEILYSEALQRARRVLADSHPLTLLAQKLLAVTSALREASERLAAQNEEAESSAIVGNVPSVPGVKVLRWRKWLRKLKGSFRS